jgi:transposase
VSQKGLKLNQLKIAQLSARGFSTRQIEAETGVSKATVARWLKMPEVQIQIQKFRQEIEIEVHEVSRQSANKEVAELQENLRTAAQRQLKWSSEVQTTGYNLLTKVNEWVAEIDTVVKSQLDQDGQEKPDQDVQEKKAMDIRSLLLLKLVPLLPSYARAAADMTRAGSDAEDKIFAIEEISRRLDEWNEVMKSQKNLN